MWWKISKRNNSQGTVEIGIGTDLTAEIETIPEIIIGIEVGIGRITEIGIEIEVEIEETVEVIQEIEAEVEIGLIPEKEEINPDLDQVKDTLTKVTSATTVTEQVMLHIGALDLKTI